MTVRAGDRFGNVLGARHTPWKRLRYCPVCVESDRAHTKGRECYWHRIHQAPGVFICPQHHTWVEESNVPSWGTTATFVSAEKAGLKVEPRDASESPWDKQLEEISRESATLLSIYGSMHTGETFSRNLWSYLRSRSYIRFSATRGETVRAALLAIDLVQNYSADFLKLLGWDPHEITSKLRYQLSEILRHKQYSREPVLLPLLAILISRYFQVPISELMQESGSIALTKPATARESAGSKRWPCVNPLCEYYQIPAESVRLLGILWKKKYNSGSHCSSLSKITSRLICTCGCRWAVTQYKTSKGAKGAPDRTRIIDHGERWRAELRRLWDDQSYSIGRIAERLHARRSTIRGQARKLGLTLPRNEQQRKRLPANADFMARRGVQRTSLKEFLRRYPSSVRRDLNKEHQSLYMWFVTWDRSWFDQCLPPRNPYTSPRRPRRSISDTLATATRVSVVSDGVLTPCPVTQVPSDAELAHHVRVRALQMFEEGSLLRICWPTLRKQIPELSISDYQLRKLPLTYTAVRDVTETGEEASVRRMFLLARQWSAQGQGFSKRKLLQRSSSAHVRKSPMVQHALQTVLEDQFE